MVWRSREDARAMRDTRKVLHPPPQASAGPYSTAELQKEFAARDRLFGSGKS